MLSRIVNGDETWVPHITMESKQQSMEWRHTSSPFQVKEQDYGKSVLGLTRCFAGGHYVTKEQRSTQVPTAKLYLVMEVPKSIAKQTAQHTVKRCFALPQ
ncbi:hypothetical protein TNCV_1590091 [Trichonephila clavipes]|uniref:Uncharacterized protein n=1 Tax=Trichonephila clavipes TaxID=2585209 RepID=A0A8X6RF33_TRICX|nr:hypothetical protein TNCV_1590091 [Trichonephila clavipes]